jgi:anti-sigma factor RsiW
MKCPTKGKLLQFAEGRILENEHRFISTHLDGCPECQDILRKFKVDSSLIRKKLKMLDPATIPLYPFTPSKARQIQARRRSSFPIVWRASVRVPATVLIVIGIVFIGLVSGLVVQGVHLARIESRSAALAQANMVIISAASSFQAYGLDIDLKDYQPIDHPNIIFLQEEIQ